MSEHDPAVARLVAAADELERRDPDGDCWFCTAIGPHFDTCPWLEFRAALDALAGRGGVGDAA